MASSHCQCIHFCRPSFYGHGQSRLVPVRLPLSISIFSSPISIQYRGFKCRPKLVFKDSVSSPLPFFSLSSSSPSSGPLEEEPLVGTNDPSLRKSEKGAWKLLKEANTFLPHVVLASTLLALIFPPSFTWFTNRYYAPALGFLMFAVGINLNPSDFINAFQRPWILLAGYIGQFLIKPFLGVLFATLGVSVLHLPPAIGSGMILVSCVSGAQLSNYATFLVEQEMAPLSIVMTAISTATAVFVTPALTSLLLGKRLPVDFWGMVVNITQIVVAPIATGIVLNRFAADFSRFIRPAMPILSVIVTSLCVGSPLAMNVQAVKSPFGISVLVLVFGFHSVGFLLGYHLARIVFQQAVDVLKIQKTISFETGMQSSLLGLALANKFFPDPLVGLPSAISTVLMSLMGFALVLYWNLDKERIVTAS